MSKSIKTLLGASALITVGMLAGRLLGLVREMMIAGYFGTGTTADLAIVLLIIPDFVTGALIGNGASAALVPAFSRHPHAESIAMFWQALLVSILAFSLIGCVMYWQHGALGLSALPPDQIRTILLPTLASLPLSAATAIVMAYLQYRGRFFAPAFSTALFNCAILAMLFFIHPSLTILAWAIMLASSVRLLAHLVAFWRSGGGFSREIFTHWHLRSTLVTTYAATAGNGIFGMLPQYMPYLIAALAGMGIAVFNYAFKLVMVPAMLGQTIVQMALLPWFVHMRKEKSREQQRELFGVSLKLGWIVSWCAAFGLTIIATPLVTLCFGYGRMTSDDIRAVSSLFCIGVWAVPGMILTSIWQQILYAHEQPRAPLIASILQAACIGPLASLGYFIANIKGVVAGYVFVQVIPVIWLARHAKRCGLVSSSLPSATCIWATFAASIPFIFCIYVMTYLQDRIFLQISITALVCLIALAIGILADRDILQFKKKWMQGI